MSAQMKRFPMSKSYPSKHHSVIASVEETHFWFHARRELIVSLLHRYIPNPSAHRFCEIGFGTGEILSEIEHLGFQTTGIDINAQAVTYAKKKTHATVIRTSLASFHPAEKFDAIGLFDVLEHQKDDEKFLRSCVPILKPGGLLFLTAPAGQVFWSEFDSMSGHVRRYSPRTLLPILERSGYTVVYWNYWNCLMSPGILFRKYVSSTSITPYVKIPPRLVNTLYYDILHIENMLFSRIRYLFGASIVVVARRLV